MFSKVVPVQQRLGDTTTALPQGSRVVGHAGNRFQNSRMVGRLVGRFSPAEGGMAGHQNRRNRKWIEIPKTAADRETGVVNVVSANVLLSELFGYGNRTVEVIRMRGSVGGNLPPGLGPRRGIFRMRVHHPADAGKLFVE